MEKMKNSINILGNELYEKKKNKYWRDDDQIRWHWIHCWWIALKDQSMKRNDENKTESKEYNTKITLKYSQKNTYWRQWKISICCGKRKIEVEK